jgi:acyl transferase domain-containing protein/thioesterase domain-containing protein
MTKASFQVEPGSIAVVGIAGHFPAARSASDLWRLLREGREATQWPSNDELRAAGVPDSELADPNYVRATLVLPDLEMFDAEFFGFSRRDAAVLDPQHRHFLECAWEALEDAGHMPEHFEGSIGVFGGCGMQAYFTYNLLTNPQLVKSMGLFLLRHTGNDKDFLCSRVSYLLNLKGPSVSVQTACSTSLVAVHMAAQSLLSGECDMALAGAASIELPHGQGYRFAEGEILSPDGHCRAFDDAAAGTVFGSGAALVVLRRLEDALRDGDNIYAVIRGSAVNNDGSQKAGYLAPSVDGQASAAAEALAVAGVEPGSVQYIEAHGTGTAVGDPIEVAALTQAYGEGGHGFCGIGSIKTNIGHLDTAAGTASLIKVALALRHELIPASLNFTRPNSRIDLGETPFAVVSQARPWPRGDTPRRAAVNSLGVGGTNAHAIIEEPPLVETSEVQPGMPQVFTFSARNPASLDRLKAKWLEFLAQPPPDFTLADAAYTLQVGRRSFEHRCAIVAADVEQLRTALQAKHHARSVTSKAGNEPGVVFMFPGGGAHYPGAGRELLTQAAFREAVDECFALMPGDAPVDLRAAMFEHDAQDVEAQRTLQRPRYAIPALFVLEYAIARLWASWGIRPAAVIGHSAGEYAAACLAGAMSLADSLAIVVLRGQIFEAAPPGAMLSVDLGEEELRTLMQGLDLDIAAVNAPDLCIASGALGSIAALEERLAQRGLEGRRLHIDVAAHSRLLDGVLERFRARVARMQFATPSIPFISNVTGDWADESLIRDSDYWVRHLRQPVRFAHGLAHLRELPDAVLVEVGPGQGLCALARQNQLGAQRMILASTCKAQEPNADLALMMTSTGALWTRGVTPDWAALREGAPRHRISLPTYAFERQRHWVDPGIPAVSTEAPIRPIESRKPAIERLPAMDDWLRVPQWTAAPPAQAPSSGNGQWLVFGNGSQLTADVLAKAQAAGARVMLVRAGRDFAKTSDRVFTIAPEDAQQCVRLLTELESGGFMPDHIVHLWALDTDAGVQLARDRTLAFDSLVHLAQAIQHLDVDRPIHLTVVTAGTFAVQGEAVPHAERALALGPCRVIPRELPNVSTRLVELATAELSSGEAARAIVLEAAATAEGPSLVAWREGARWMQQLAKAGAGPAQVTLREGGVYLITGGLGDIALELAAYLAKTKKARLALVSRRVLPPKSIWPALAASGDHSAEADLVRRLLALEDQGAKVAAFSADAGDRLTMARVIGECRAMFGTLHGVFHAAGVLDDAPIAAKTPESIGRVLGAKAQGAQVLHELLPPGSLDVFAMFSSTSVLLGTAGQVDYVAANAFLDSLAGSRPDGFTIRWGIWGDRGMAARAYGGHLASQPLPAGTHPLLGLQVDSDNGAAFETTYDSRALWVLAEHLVGGRCVLPATAYIEIARAAMMVLHPGASIEIRSLSYEEAMMFEPGASRQVRTELRRSGAGYELTVRSRGAADQDWVEHAHGGTSVLLESLPPQPAQPMDGWQPGTIPQERVVAFGERWHNIVRMQLGVGEARARIELPQRFRADLGSYAAHPALTDMGATFGLHLLGAAHRAGQLFVPLSVERIRLAAPLPAELVSHVRLREGADARLASFDVALCAPDGRTLATMDGFSMRGVPAGAIPQQQAREPSLAESMLAAGIRGEDAHELWGRIFHNPVRDLVVSSIDSTQLEQAISAAAAKAASRPARSDSQAAPSSLNPVEAMLAEVWRELLGVEDVTADDDFFALGGHSLAAVRLFARIRKHYGVDLPLATLFQAPTLGALAGLVAQQAGVSLEKPAHTEAPKKSNVIPIGAGGWSPLVTICRGSVGRIPLFCVHGAGGNVLNFKVISDRLGPDQPFYGLQAQGVDGRLRPLGSIEEMAAQYLQSLRAVRPHGPYQLAGYSAGGVIALEMAAQLKLENEPVSLLAMIDTLSPLAAARKVPFLEKLWLLRHFNLEYALQWSQRRSRARLDEANYAFALQRLARGEALPPELVDVHLFYKFIEAQSRYSPQPYEGDLVLFKASRANMLYLSAGPALGWDRHVHGQIRITNVTGSHLTIMSEPGVSELIEGLRVELGLSERRPESPEPTTIGTLAEAPTPATQRPG